MFNLKTIFAEKKLRNRTIVITSVIAVLAILIGLICFYVYGSHTIYAGVLVNGMDIGQLTKEEAIEKLENSFQQDHQFTVTYEGNEKTIVFSDFDASYDYNAIVERAYQLGREGNFFQRSNEMIRLMTKKEDIPLQLNFNEEKLKGILAEFAYEFSEPLIDNEITISGEKMIIKKGKAVNAINADQLYQTVLQQLENYRFDPIQAAVEPVEPEPLDADKIYEQYHKEPQDAYIEEKDGKTMIVKEVIGVDFDVEELRKILSEDKETYEIPVTLTYPKVTYNTLTGTLFQDELSSYTTQYNGNDVNRTNNLRLATQKINGTILNPGQVFSYNNTVGRRTYEEGYRDAKVYVGGEVVDGMAGGICQVSSTLYAAVCYADLKIVSRTNHQLTVGYVPLGLDATVVYGAIDFKFSNNTSAPIKIVASAGGGSLNIKILGTNDDPGKKVTMSSTTIATHPFTEIVRENKDVEPGKTVIKQRGSDGYTVSTYRIVTKNGVTIKNEFMGNSKYSPTNLIKEVNTITEETPSEATPTPPPDATPTPQTPSPELSLTPEPTPELEITEEAPAEPETE